MYMIQVVWSYKIIIPHITLMKYVLNYIVEGMQGAFLS